MKTAGVSFRKSIAVLLFSLAIVSFTGNRLQLEDIDAELLLDEKAMLGEGSIWHPKENKLYWVDIKNKILHIYDPVSKVDRELPVNSRIGTIVPVERRRCAGGLTERSLWGGYCVAKFNPRTGELLQKIKVPAPNVSSCAFGGKNFETLYITTARQFAAADKLKEFPLSGGLFTVKPGVRGVPAFFYKGKL